jgi:hypothetical protein
MGAKERNPSPRGRNSIPGQVEARLERAVAVWRRRCQGASMPTLAREFNLSLSTVHDYIEEQRKLLRAQAIHLAAQERDQALELLDNAIEQVVPHINGQVLVQTELQRENSKGEPRLVVITVEEWQACMKGCQVLVSLLDRKAKLLGMDAPVRVEPPPTVPPESEDQRARARAALKAWTKFAVDPKDFQSQDLG